MHTFVSHYTLIFTYRINFQPFHFFFHTSLHSCSLSCTLKKNIYGWCWEWKWKEMRENMQQKLDYVSWHTSCWNVLFMTSNFLSKWKENVHLIKHALLDNLSYVLRFHNLCNCASYSYSQFLLLLLHIARNENFLSHQKFHSFLFIIMTIKLK